MTKPYELLARFRPDGTVAGVSVRTLTTVAGRDYESDPAPLSSATDPAFTAFASAFSAAAVAERDAAVASLATATASLATVTAELEALRNPTDSQGFPVLTAVQLRLGILGVGMSLDKIDDAIASIPDTVQRVTVSTYWQYATEFHRSNPLIAGMVSLLGLTEADADAIWRAAGAIR